MSLVPAGMVVRMMLRPNPPRLWMESRTGCYLPPRIGPCVEGKEGGLVTVKTPAFWTEMETIS